MLATIPSLIMTNRNTLKAAALLALTSVSELVSGHSWVEQANRIAPNGTLVGPTGYPPNWFGRNSPEFSDTAVTNEIRADNTDLCARQPIGDQKDGFPVLTAAPGDFVALRYTENGHVTKQEPHRPLKGGVVYVYGTSEPRPNENVADVHRKWTADGTGGDGRGRLLATRHYDDGQCYEANDMEKSIQRQQTFPKTNEQPYGPNLWCQTDFQVPQDIPQDSQYVVYWVWTWPQLKNVEGSESGLFRDFPPESVPAGGEQMIDEGILVGQLYSSCLAINVKGEPLVDARAAGVGKFSTDRFIDNRQDWNEAANRGQLENQFQVDVNEIPGGGDAPSGAPPAPPVGAPTEQPAAPAPTSTTATTSTRTGMRTVTVTAEPTTVYATATITAGAGENDAAPTGAPPAGGPPEVPGAVPSVEPFIPRRALKAHRSSWSFGRED